jgi:hypothetical protein
VNGFLHKAEEILEIAVAGNGDAGDLAIVIDRQGAMRMLDPGGWSLSAMCAEFGAAAAYRVERRGRTIRVEGWGGGDRCLLQREILWGAPSNLRLGVPALSGQPSERFESNPLPICSQTFTSPNSLQKYYTA